jgi:uncharacterized protein YndB with AHSA1/START domain
MTATLPLCHGTFTLTRDWAAAPARVFRAWTDPALKARWFAGPPGWQEERREMDVRPGGEERMEGRFTETGMTTRFHARYHLVEAGARLVYDYDLHLSDVFHSITLASLSLQPTAAGTRVAYTEQIVFLDGKDGTARRQDGTAWHFTRIAEALGLAEHAQ